MNNPNINVFRRNTGFGLVTLFAFLPLFYTLVSDFVAWTRERSRGEGEGRFGVAVVCVFRRGGGGRKAVEELNAMPLYRGDLGLGGVKGVVEVVMVSLFPLLVYVVRRKWKIEKARKEEIRRLVLHASEEATRAEIEYQFENTGGLSFCGSGGADGDGGGNGVGRLCAVCYNPTTTRCSRCKAVKYCSGKCQIIHWRQGHKDECHPPADTQHDGPGTYKEFKSASDEQSKLYDDASNDYVTQHVEAHVKDDTLSETDSFYSSSVPHKEDDVEVRHPVNRPDGTEKSVFTTVSSSVYSPEKLDGISTVAKYAPVCPTKQDRYSSCDIGSSSSKNRVEFPRASVNSSVSGKLNHQTASFTFEESVRNSVVESGIMDSSYLKNVPFSTHRGIEDSESSLSFKGGFGDSRDVKKDLTPQVDPKPFSFSTSIEAVISRSNSGSRTDPDGVPSFKNSCHSESKVSSSSYFEAYGSISIENSCSVNSTASKSAHDASSANISCVSRGNNVSTPPIKPSGNSSFASNGGHALKSSDQRVVEQFKPSKPSKSYKMFPTYDLYIKLYSDRVELQPGGLINCGNSCYANAILQCLIFTRPLTAYLLQGLHSTKCSKREWCFTCELEGLIVKMKHGTSPLSPIGIVSQIHKLGSSLDEGKEEDAHEFLRCAIDAMQKACLGETGNPLGEHSDETTLMQLIFGGHLRSKIRCLRCQGTSERYERIMDLTVEIGSGDINTLERALERFTNPEILDGENKYNCNRCKSYEKGRKRLTISEAPNVLTIALKRFESGLFGKLNKKVKFPDILNMANYMSSGSRDKSPVYCLYAVVVHEGRMNVAFSGHYVCYVKNTLGKWYKNDDSKVKTVELDQVLSVEAYLLFYARISPRAPRSMLNVRKYPQVLTSRTIQENDDSKCSSEDCGGVNSVADFDLYSPHNSERYSQIHKVESSSEMSSLITNSSSDGGSVSTDSTRDSIGDYSDYIFGESGCYNWNSPSNHSDDSDGLLTSYSPSSSRGLLSESISYGCFPDLSSPVEQKSQFLNSDTTTKQSRKLTQQHTGGGGGGGRSREREWYNPWKKKASRLFMRSGRDG